MRPSWARTWWKTTPRHLSAEPGYAHLERQTRHHRRHQHHRRAEARGRLHGQDDNGKNLALSSLDDLQFTMAGPTTDYGYTSFGSDVTTPGYVTESGTKAPATWSGPARTPSQHAIPAAATGTYAIGVEAEQLEAILQGTNAAQRSKAEPLTRSSTSPWTAPLWHRAEPWSPSQLQPVPRARSRCTAPRRNNTDYCVMCHNPSDTDASSAALGVAADKAAPAQTINFNLMVHRIHDGVNVVAYGGKPYIVVGFGGGLHDFSDVLFPAMSPEGSATDLQNCAMCHVNSSEQTLPIGLNPSSIRRAGPIRPRPLPRLAADATCLRPKRLTSWRIPTRHWVRAVPCAMPPARSSRWMQCTPSNLLHVPGPGRLRRRSGPECRPLWYPETYTAVIAEGRAILTGSPASTAAS